MNKEEQKKLLIEIMEADEKDGLYKTNNMAQQTAVEQLEKKLKTYLSWSSFLEEDFAKAKQIEKEQIIDAWEDGKDSFSSRSAEQYCNETYGK